MARKAISLALRRSSGWTILSFNFDGLSFTLSSSGSIIEIEKIFESNNNYCQIIERSFDS